MALPPDPKNEAEKGLKTGAGAVASVLTGIFDAAVSAMTKILPGTASTPTDPETPPASFSTSNNNDSSTQLNEKLSKILKEVEEIEKNKEKEMTPGPDAIIPSSKDARQNSDTEKKLTDKDKQFVQDINKINQLPSGTPRRK